MTKMVLLERKKLEGMKKADLVGYGLAVGIELDGSKKHAELVDALDAHLGELREKAAAEEAEAQKKADAAADELEKQRVSLDQFNKPLNRDDSEIIAQVGKEGPIRSADGAIVPQKKYLVIIDEEEGQTEAVTGSVNGIKYKIPRGEPGKIVDGAVVESLQHTASTTLVPNVRVNKATGQLETYWRTQKNRRFHFEVHQVPG